MPICSYVVFPAKGEIQQAQDALEALPECSVHPALNEDLLVLVTDTPDDGANKRLHSTLNEMDHIECVVLSFAHSDPVPNSESPSVEAL